MKYKEIKKMLFAKMDEIIDEAMKYEFMTDDIQYLAKQIHDISQVIGQNGAGFNVIQSLIKKYNDAMSNMDFGIAISYLLDMVMVINPEDPYWSEDYEKHLRRQMLEAVHILLKDATKKLKKSPLKNDFIADLYLGLALAELGEENTHVLNIDFGDEEVPVLFHMSDEEVADIIAQQEEEEAEYEAFMNVLNDEETESDMMEEEFSELVEDEWERKNAFYETVSDYAKPERATRMSLINEWMYY